MREGDRGEKSTQRRTAAIAAGDEDRGMTTRSIPDDILAQHIAVLGKTGSGKTSTAKLAIEQVVAAGARVCILDPIKSDWWGLTSSADGKKPGLPFHILGGPRGHVPLHASAGKAIGEIVANGQLPLSIIDMADFEPGGQAKFFVDFAPTLLRKMRGVVYLVIEEAHLFAPKERSGVGAENLSIHWAKTLATAGRSKGIRLLLVTQRTQALHNALLGSCDTLIAHRLTAPADQEPVVKWLKANTTKEVLEQVAGSLASLKTGDGWICSGEAKLFELVHFARIKTYDNTATPTGDGDIREIKTAAVDQDKLRTIIGEAVKEAQANDPRELRKQVAGLQQELAKAQQVKPGSSASIRTVEKPVLTAADHELLGKLSERIAALSSGLDLDVQKLIEEIRVKVASAVNVATSDMLTLLKRTDEESHERLHRIGFEKIIGKLSAISSQPSTTNTPATHATGSRTTPAASQGRRVAPAVATSRPSSLPPARADGTSLKKGAREILAALAAKRPTPMTWSQLALLCAIKATGSTMSSYMSNLRTAGFITESGEVVNITDAGLAYFGDDIPAALQSKDAVLEVWRGRLKRGARAILEDLDQAYPKWRTKADLGERVLGISSGGSTLSSYLSNLRTAGLIQEQGDQVRLSEELFS